MSNTKGLSVQIYRAEDTDFSNGGISSWADSVVLVGPNVPEVVEVRENRPAVRFERRTIMGATTFRAVPVNENGEGAHWMMGGTFIYTSDSRFRWLTPTGQPIALHDRREP